MVDGHFVEWEFKALYYWEFNFARLPIDYRILVTEDCCTNLNEQDFTGTSFRRDCGKIAEWKLEILPNGNWKYCRMGIDGGSVYVI